MCIFKGIGWCFFWVVGWCVQQPFYTAHVFLVCGFRMVVDGLPENVHITGVMVSYYFVCHTKLWLFAHNITMEREHGAVEMGRSLHETSYRRDRREMSFPGAKMDFVRRGRVVEVHEVKKSRRMERADRFQLLYYLYVLRGVGVDAVGVLNYPVTREVVRVVPSDEDFREMERVLGEVERIVRGPFVRPEKKRICRKCAYFEFCWGD